MWHQEVEKAAEVFEEFVASFGANDQRKTKTFVRGGIVNATKGEYQGLRSICTKDDNGLLAVSIIRH